MGRASGCPSSLSLSPLPSSLFCGRFNDRLEGVVSPAAVRRHKKEKIEYVGKSGQCGTNIEIARRDFDRERERERRSSFAREFMSLQSVIAHLQSHTERDP